MSRAVNKLFLITILLIIISGILIYKGVEEEVAKRQTALPSPFASAEEIKSDEKLDDVLGEEYSASVSAEENLNAVSVTKVIDGDTFEVLINNQKFRVRMIGVDTPETVHPTQPKGCFGAEASDETKRLLTNKKVILEKDVSETDKYDRLLRYVYVLLDDGRKLFINDYLVREGYAQVLTYPPDVKFNEQFLEAQRNAKNQKKGLWGKCG